MTPVKVLLFTIAVGAIGLMLARVFVQYRSPMPAGLGVRDGRLRPCPTTPNCVSTQAAESDLAHHIEPIPYNGDLSAARQKLVAIIEEMPRATFIANESNYIHVGYRSFLWGFIDDVEFFLDEESGLIHSRSAARLGYGDLGVNRQRLEAIRLAFES